MIATASDLAVDCPFCGLRPNRVLWECEHVVVIRDRFPVSPGHSLIIPKRHVESLFDTSHEEKLAILGALEMTKRDLDQRFGAQAYNIGINDGAAAGQTVPHLHVHLIPRLPGDVDDPRGGVRWVVPEKAPYW